MERSVSGELIQNGRVDGSVDGIGLSLGTRGSKKLHIMLTISGKTELKIRKSM